MSTQNWALMMQNARDMEHQAEILRWEAAGARCDAEGSCGARCTRDRHAEGDHRHEQADLP